MKKIIILPLLAVTWVTLSGCQHTPGTRGASVFAPFETRASVVDAVQTSLNNHPQLVGLPIKIEENNGTIILTGYVKTIRQSDIAADLAGKTPGVRMVENNLIVRK